MLHENGKNSAYFVDSLGFIELSGFMRKLEGVRDTFGHDVQKTEPEDIEDGDEIIDLGDETEQVLAEMKKSLEGSQDTSGHDAQNPEQAAAEEVEETEIAFQIADRYISIQETEGGYDYSIMDADYKELDGGVYDNPDVSIREALKDIMDDLKSAPDHNGVKGNIHTDDELIPIDYDDLMEKVEEADRIITEIAQRSVVDDFRARTNELFHEINGKDASEIEEIVKCYVQAQIDEYGIDAIIVDAVVTGSRCRGIEKDGSDIDVAVEFFTNEREDYLFNILNENGLLIGGIKVDINPITAQKTGTLESYLPQAEEYLVARKGGPEVTLTVAECGEFHNLGEFHENILTVEEAVKIWKQIPPERMNGRPAIGIKIHTQGDELFNDVVIDILCGKGFYLDILEDIPVVKGNTKVTELIAELIAKLPEMKIAGTMSKEMETKVWEMRMPDLDVTEQLAVELDRFSYDYDTYEYNGNFENMTEGVSVMYDMLTQGNTGDIEKWLNEVVSEGAVPEEVQRAKELLEKLAEYKPLAKIEEMEESNYNMVDDVLNNGTGEKTSKEDIGKPSLKTRLMEKKALVSGQEKDHKEQENIKNNQREM